MPEPVIEYVIRNTKERLYIMEYGPDHPFHDLKWTWTMEWEKAQRYATSEIASQKVIEYGVEMVSRIQSTA